VLGLVRPYDLVLLGAVRLLAVAATEPARRWLRAAVPLLGLLPVLAYDVFVFFGSDQFASFRRGGAFPPRLDFVPALGPAAALALASLRRPVADHGTRRARAHLWAWAGSALLDRHGVTHVVVPGDAGPRPGPPARRAGKIAP
jgi:hypothetical protein